MKFADYIVLRELNLFDLIKGFIMGISSLGVGSSVLTQDVLDQLRAADDYQYVTPIDNKISTEEDKSTALEQDIALMDNVYESLKSLNEYGVFESRVATSSNEDVATVTAEDTSDIQDFSLEVINLATKEIEQSGSFLTKDASIATGSGQMELVVGSETYLIDYDASTTLDELKNLINDKAGVSVDATIVQVGTGDFRLMLNADDTGTGQDISITDLGDGAGNNTLNTSLTTGMSNVQTAVDANFKFNGLDIVRQSNSVDDLLTGVTITLNEAGTTNVSIAQDRENIESKITNFVDKYNSALYQLEEDTKSSQDDEVRGVFSSDSTIKSMTRDIQNILNTVGGGVGSLQDYGIEIGDDGRLSLDSEVLNDQLDENPDNVKAFFVGGDFLKSDGSRTEVSGAFVELEDTFAKYSKYDAILENYQTSVADRIDNLTTDREKAIERLDTKYEIMAKQWAAYDSIINGYNNAADMFAALTADNSSDN